MSDSVPGGANAPVDRICLSVSSFHDELRSSRMGWTEFLHAAGRLGFGAVELCDRSVPSCEPGVLYRIREA
jgi:hypothetical protein